MQLSPNQKKFSATFLHFQNLHKILNTLKKQDDPRKLFVSEIIHYKKQGYRNAEKAASQNTYRQSTC